MQMHSRGDIIYYTNHIALFSGHRRIHRHMHVHSIDQTYYKTNQIMVLIGHIHTLTMMINSNRIKTIIIWY